MYRVMHVRNSLFATVSAAALALGSVQYAEAQQAKSGTPTYWLSLEGQYIWVNGDAVDLDFYPDGISLEPDNGWTGRFEYGGRISNDWSAALGVRYGRTFEEDDSFNLYYFPPGQTEYQEDHLVIDLEIGRDVGLGGQSTARVFGGARFAYLDGDGDGSISYDGYTIDLSSEHRFIGGGPRLGFDAVVPLGGGAQLDIGAAGSVLIGKRKGKASISDDGYGYEESKSKTKVIPNLEASAALTYMVGSNMSLSAGYRVEQFWNIMPTIEEDGFGSSDRLIHGPFVQFAIKGW